MSCPKFVTREFTVGPDQGGKYGVGRVLRIIVRDTRSSGRGSRYVEEVVFTYSNSFGKGSSEITLSPGDSLYTVYAGDQVEVQVHDVSVESMTVRFTVVLPNKSPLEFISPTELI
jgi:hypothetical protein